MESTQIKSDFPIFQAHPELVYLDNAATTHKPRCVVDAMYRFYTAENASINRGLYQLGAQASRKYQAVREQLAGFLGASSRRELVYTSGTTDSINLVAQSFLLPRLQPGDEVLVTAMEHHANLIPWQEVCRQSGAQLIIAPVNEKGELDMKAFTALVGPQTKFIAVVHVSNSLGTINPIKKIIDLAHGQAQAVPVLVDAAQSAAYYPLDVQDLDCDFLVFSGHKVFGPTGIGVLFGKLAHLEQMRAIRFGGDMIERVTYQETTFAQAPRRFEAGTANIAGVIGLGAALAYLQNLDRSAILQQLAGLRDQATEALQSIDQLKIIGTARNKSAIVSFVLEEIHPHDIASFLGASSIAIRAGHHCTQPLMDAWGLPGTVRASFSIYNTAEDIDRLVEAVKEVQVFFM
jgi:cysteine desulfurase/selenocysteine lyase